MTEHRIETARALLARTLSSAGHAGLCDCCNTDTSSRHNAILRSKAGTDVSCWMCDRCLVSVMFRKAAPAEQQRLRDNAITFRTVCPMPAEPVRRGGRPATPTLSPARAQAAQLRAQLAAINARSPLARPVARR